MKNITTIDLGNKIDLDTVPEIFQWEEYGQKGHFSTKYGASIKLAGYPQEFNGRTYRKTFTVGGWTAEGEGRIEFGGPMVQGPHAYLMAEGVVLTPHAEPDEIHLVIDEGHEITVAGTTYRVVKAPNKNYELERVGA